MAFTEHDANDIAKSKVTDPRDSLPGIPLCSISQNITSDDGALAVDRGKHAWLFLLASAMLEALVWGEFRLKRSIS